jgi:small subunit ribosomal protein S5e
MSLLPKEYAKDNGVKLFNQWSFEQIQIKDESLTAYIQVTSPVFLPHTAGRYQTKRFRKAQVIITRLISSVQLLNV